MSKRSGSSGEYEVGYGKPPARTRFRPGRSGNPNGTPKGGWPKRDRELARIEKILGRTVTVRNGDTAEAMQVLDAAYLAVAAKALKGDLKALAFLESRREAALERVPQTAALGEDDLAILNSYLARARGEARDPTGAMLDQVEPTSDQGGVRLDADPSADMEE